MYILPNRHSRKMKKILLTVTLFSRPFLGFDGPVSSPQFLLTVVLIF